MNFNEIYNLLQNFGIFISRNDKGELIFFDNEYAEWMLAESVSDSSFVSMITTPSAPFLNSPDMIQTDRYIRLKSKHKCIGYTLARRNAEGNTVTYLKSFYYEKRMKNACDYNYVELDIPTRNGASLGVYSQKESYENGSIQRTSKQISVLESDCLKVKIGESCSCYLDGEITEFGLTNSDMKEEIDSNEMLAIFLKFYSDKFPQLTETVKSVKLSPRKEFTN